MPPKKLSCGVDMTMELRIEKMVQGGDGMARLPDGRICFVSGALPGELCKVRLTFQKKDFTRGVVEAVLEANPDRVNPRCPLYGRCGGCSLQHLASEKQVEYLERVERENFKRLAHAELPGDFKIHVGNPWGYRNRARVVACDSRDSHSRNSRSRDLQTRDSQTRDSQTRDSRETRSFGFRIQESNKVIPFDQCPVLTPALNEFLKGPAREIRANELNIFDNGAGEVSYFYRGMSAADFKKHAVSIVDIGGRKIESDASVFFQSNLGLLPELVNSVRTAVDEGLASGEASDEWLIDLFSGVGFFASLLQDKFKRITTVERDEGCLKHANVNLSVTCATLPNLRESLPVENVSAPAEEWLAQNVVDVPATLIVDPPRTGLPKEALEAIVKSSVNRLIYVSCDPVTLARDYAKFAQAGFALKRAEGFAFYPQTPHLEMMFVLSR